MLSDFFEEEKKEEKPLPFGTMVNFCLKVSALIGGRRAGRRGGGRGGGGCPQYLMLINLT